MLGCCLHTCTTDQMHASRHNASLGTLHHPTSRVTPLRVAWSFSHLVPTGIQCHRCTAPSATSSMVAHTAVTQTSNDKKVLDPLPHSQINPVSSKGGKGEEPGVPETLTQCLSVFFTHPSVLLAMAIIGSIAYWRMYYGGPLTIADLAAAVSAATLWLFQEWAIHRYLLHSSFNWLGKNIHEAHHLRPYHHISIDGPEIVGGFMAVVAVVFWLLLHSAGANVVATACVSYYTTGLLSYQLVHYLSHTKWVPKHPYMKAMRRHHMLHHLRNCEHWFAFSIPAMDSWFGTAPTYPSQVPMKTFLMKYNQNQHTS